MSVVECCVPCAQDLSAASESSAGVAFRWCPLILLAGVGNEFVALRVGCCEVCVDIGVDEGDEMG